jgi:hypothetical protein
LIAKIGPIQKDFHRVHILNSALMREWDIPVCVNH